MSQSFIKKPYQGSHSALAGLGVLGHEQGLTPEQQHILDSIPKRCEPCRSVGAVHCSDPANCGGPWDDHDRTQWLLYEHDDGRHAVAPNAEAATFAKGDPAWHRVGPVEAHALPLPDAMAGDDGEFSQYRAGWNNCLEAVKHALGVSVRSEQSLASLPREAMPEGGKEAAGTSGVAEAQPQQGGTDA